MNLCLDDEHPSKIVNKTLEGVKHSQRAASKEVVQHSILRKNADSTVIERAQEHKNRVS
jgi:hypothetical protein